MTDTAAENMTALRQIRTDHYAGLLSWEEAQAKAQPYVDRINEGNATIAKKYGKRPKKVSFGYIMRAID